MLGRAQSQVGFRSGEFVDHFLNENEMVLAIASDINAEFDGLDVRCYIHH